MHTETILYQDGDISLEGYVAYDDSDTHKRPAVLVAHDWSGRNEFACQKAEKLAELGYVGFAWDLYGKGIIGSDNDEKTQLITPFMEDRGLLRSRSLLALQTLKQLENVDSEKMAGIGFCFGGLCVLDLARSGADLCGVVSFHGLFKAPEGLETKPIKAKVLALHGNDDPMVPPEDVAALEKELTEAKVDWQIHVYGNIMHAFTNPVANDPDFGTVYNSTAEKRSWIAMQNFLTEVFA